MVRCLVHILLKLVYRRLRGCKSYGLRLKKQLLQRYFISYNHSKSLGTRANLVLCRCWTRQLFCPYPHSLKSRRRGSPPINWNTKFDHGASYSIYNSPIIGRIKTSIIYNIIIKAVTGSWVKALAGRYAGQPRYVGRQAFGQRLIGRFAHESVFTR